MKRSRLAVVLALLAVAAFVGTDSAHAICGFAGQVVVSIFPGAAGAPDTAWVVLFSPTTFEATGQANVTLGTAFGDAAYNTFLTAVDPPVPSFLMVTTAITPSCPACAYTGATFGFCGAATAVTIFS